MSKNPQPTPEELRFVYGMIAQGYDVNAILNEYCRLYESGQLKFPFRTDRRFIQQRKIELEAAEDILRARDIKQPSLNTSNSLHGHYMYLADIAKTILADGLDNIRDEAGDGIIFTFDDKGITRVIWDELPIMLENNLKSARHRFGTDDLEWFIEHIEAENPEIKRLGFQKYLEEESYSLIKLLKVLTRRQTFKGKCPVCRDW